MRPAAMAASAWLALASACAKAPPDTAFPPPPPPEYSWRLPAGFPEPRVPLANPMTEAKVELGRRLFFDQRLSGNQTLSCAGCHRPELAFTDGRPRAVGSTGALHPRGAMSLANVAYARNFNWADPTTRSLEEQMLTPMFGEHPIELGLAGRERELLDRLARDPLYPSLFATAFGSARPVITVDHVIAAVASYERSLFAGNSAYDRWLFFDEPLPDDAQRGMRLFFSPRLACSECHGGFTLSGPVIHVASPDAEPEFHNTGLYNLDGQGSYPVGNRGLYEHTGRPEDMGKFRAPTLRNITLTAPYMHDGSAATLDEVLDHYAAGGRNSGPEPGPTALHNPLKSPLLDGFALSAGKRADLLAFLASLTEPDLRVDPGATEATDATHARGGTDAAPRG